MYQVIQANKVKSVILVVVFVLVILVAAYVYLEASGYGGSTSAYSFIGIGIIIYAIINYYISSKITLAISGAKQIQKKDAPELYRVVDTLAITTGVPTPKIYIIESNAINAFATGRNPSDSSVAITRGLLNKLTKVELEGVMAHELSHIKNYDMRLMTLVAIFAGLLTLLSDFFLRFSFWGGSRRSKDNKLQGIMMIVGIVLALLSPFIALLIRMAISRKREYLADATAAMITRYPEGLASALEKIAGDTAPLENANKALAHLYIANPLKSNFINNMFATHPPIKERIRVLRSMIG